ncbi:hypothetical protein ZTR_10467 [Talaromyces verruculosus]|nr:hypothetical protein ZTR_10467 [Talaromyces verruculosus]
MIHDVPMRITPDSRLNIAEALSSYAELKRCMLSTIEYGLNGNSMPASTDHTTATMHDYQTAKETLNQYAHLLQLEGFEVGVDDANEDLTPFYFNEKQIFWYPSAEWGILAVVAIVNHPPTLPLLPPLSVYVLNW